MHYADIVKVQNVQSKIAYKNGTTRDELRRSKDKSRIVKSILKASKSPAPIKRCTSVPPGASIRRQTTMETRRSQFIPQSMLRSHSLKTRIGQVTSFCIQNKSVRDRPVNCASDIILMGRASKALEIITRSQNKLPSLAKMYNNDLSEIVTK